MEIIIRRFENERKRKFYYLFQRSCHTTHQQLIYFIIYFYDNKTFMNESFYYQSFLNETTPAALMD